MPFRQWAILKADRNDVVIRRLRQFALAIADRETTRSDAEAILGLSLSSGQYTDQKSEIWTSCGWCGLIGAPASRIDHLIA